MNTYKKTFAILLAFLLLSINGFAQSLPQQITENITKKVTKFIKKGDYCYNQMELTQALHYYHSALKYMPEDALLNYKIGISYLFNQMPDSAYFFVNKSFTLNKNVSQEIHFFLGRCNQLLGYYDKAITEYKIHLKTLNDNELYLRKGTLKYIAQCEKAMNFDLIDSNITINNIGQQINTEYPEYSPIITNDGKMLIFTTRRPKTFNQVNRDNSDYGFAEEIFFATFQNNTWSDAKKIESRFNTQYNNASAGISADGKMLFVYNNKRKGNVYYSEWNDTTWGKIKSFSRKINSRNHESAVATNKNADTLYFISDRKKDNIGGNDIYFSVKNAKNKWTKPINAGNILNTPEDEEAIFITQDGNNMYFSSKGHESFGGYDIFKTVKDNNGKWTKPQNIGMPINTAEDDIFFSIYDTTAYYSTVKNGAKRNFDIFKVTFHKQPQIIVETTEIPTDTIVIEITEVTEVVEEPVEIIDIPTKVEPQIPDKYKDFPLFGSIYFDFDISNVKNQGFEMMDLIAEYLSDNPAAKISLSGHTDSDGTVEYNQILSEKRAKAALDYLIMKGIDKNRIQSSGFSENKPIDTNQTAEGRANNRRVDFEIK